MGLTTHAAGINRLVKDITEEPMKTIVMLGSAEDGTDTVYTTGQEQHKDEQGSPCRVMGQK